MSISYIVKEYLCVRNYQNKHITHAITETLASIGHQILLDNAFVMELNMVADGKRYSFCGKCMTKDFHEIILAAKHTKTNLELTLFYYAYDCYFDISNEVEDTLKNSPELSDNIFHSFYNKADCNSGSGILCAYGKKNGILYNGIINPVESPALCEGIWEACDTAISFEEDINDALDLDGIRKCANDLIELDEEIDINFEIDDKTALLYLNDISLNTVEKVKKFIDICERLQTATNYTCGFLTEFVDYTVATPRIMILDILSSDSPKILIASI